MVFSYPRRESSSIGENSLQNLSSLFILNRQVCTNYFVFKAGQRGVQQAKFDDKLFDLLLAKQKTVDNFSLLRNADNEN